MDRANFALTFDLLSKVARQKFIDIFLSALWFIFSWIKLLETPFFSSEISSKKYAKYKALNTHPYCRVQNSNSVWQKKNQLTDSSQSWGTKTVNNRLYHMLCAELQIPSNSFTMTLHSTFTLYCLPSLEFSWRNGAISSISSSLET